MSLTEKCMCGHILMRHAAVSAGVHGGKCGGFVRIDGKSKACACEAFITPEDALTLENMISTGEITVTQEVSIEEAIRRYPDREGEIRAVATNEGAKWPWRAYGEGPSLSWLQAMVDALPKMPKFPPCYRCHPATFEAIMRLIPEPERDEMDLFPEWVNFSGIKIEQDVKVTPGEFWPPEGWKP